MPAGEGRLLCQLMVQLTKKLQAEILERLAGQDFKTESECIEKAYKECRFLAGAQAVPISAWEHGPSEKTPGWAACH